MAEHVVGPDVSELAVRTGDRIVLRLPEIGGTGFVWSIDDCPAPLAPAGDERELPPWGTAGAQGERVFTFDVVSTGRGTLSLSRRRPFAPDEVDCTGRIDVRAD